MGVLSPSCQAECPPSLFLLRYVWLWTELPASFPSSEKLGSHLVNFKGWCPWEGKIKQDSNIYLGANQCLYLACYIMTNFWSLWQEQMSCVVCVGLLRYQSHLRKDIPMALQPHLLVQSPWNQEKKSCNFTSIKWSRFLLEGCLVQPPERLIWVGFSFQMVWLKLFRFMLPF